MPRVWNVTRLRKFARRGADIAEIIQRARVPGNKQVKVEAKGWLNTSPRPWTYWMQSRWDQVEET